jgi:hypothetical protein
MAEPQKSDIISTRILLLLALVAVLVSSAGIFFWPKSKNFIPVALTLPDGSTVSLVGVTYGTNHVCGGPLAQLVAKTPPSMQGLLTRLLGSRVVGRQTMTTPTPALVIWVDSPPAQKIPTLSAAGWFEAYLGDTNGFVSGSAQYYNPSFGLSYLQFEAFPRRDKNFAVHLYYHDPKAKVKDCATLGILNPLYRSYPQWQPETLPATRRVGDVEATLHQFSTGHGIGMSQVSGRDGGYAIEFGTNRDGGQNENACRLDLRPLADTNQVWQVDHVELSDATGNVIQSSGMSWTGAGNGVFGFNPGLWTNEAAWKLRCEIKRTRGFAPSEMLSFKNVPLAEMNKTNQLGWTSNFNGVSVTLDYFVRRPPLTNNSWSSAILSDAHFHMTGFSNDLHFDLIELQADNGTNVECCSWSSGVDTQDREFKNVPADAKTLDFTFAVQKGRWVEFLVKPETGPARFEFPGPRLKK